MLILKTINIKYRNLELNGSIDKIFQIFEVLSSNSTQ